MVHRSGFRSATSARNFRVRVGQYTDPTGLIYLRARYYDPATAQFLTRDPLEAVTAEPYEYADSDPLDESDPLGLWGLNPLSDLK